jgi:hypothetical protein
MTSVTPNSPSKIALPLPEDTNAAAVNGTSDAASIRSNAQWYAPWIGEGGGNVVGSLTVPLRIAEGYNEFVVYRCERGAQSGIRTTSWVVRDCHFIRSMSNSFAPRIRISFYNAIWRIIHKPGARTSDVQLATTLRAIGFCNVERRIRLEDIV